MSTNDVRDILDMKVDPNARPAKKQKVRIQRPDNISKEVFGLLGERAPPIVLQAPRQVKKPKFARRVRAWELQRFKNPLRKDGLVLQHWRQRPLATAATVDGNDENAAPEVVEGEPLKFHWAKFDVKVNRLDYTDEQYDEKMQDENWTRDETRYLTNLAEDWDLRWVVIADRYDYKYPGSQIEGQEPISTTPRTMEDMKARYYKISAIVQQIKQPLNRMTPAEFALNEKMMKFNAEQERIRKKQVEVLMQRSLDEIREEEVMLTELKKIVLDEDKFLQERKELYEKLDSAPSNGSISMYETSGGLSNLLQNLLSADRAKRKQAVPSRTDAQSPATGTPVATTPAGTERKGSLTVPTKKGSVASASGSNKHLTPRDMVKYGISQHEKLSSGVHFRSSKIDKLVITKTTSHTQKVLEAMGILHIPQKAVMPTQKVVGEYERLIAQIQISLDIRKHSDKIENDIRVYTTMRENRERAERGEDAQVPETKESEDTEMKEAEEEPEAEVEKDDEEEENADGESEHDEDENEENENEDEDQDQEAEADVDIDAEASDNEDEGQEEGSDAEAEVEGSDEEQEQDEDDDVEQPEAEVSEAEGSEQDNDSDGEVEVEAEADSDEEQQSGEEEDEDGEQEQSEQEEDNDEEQDDEEGEEENEEDEEEPHDSASIAQSTRSMRSTRGRHKRSLSQLSQVSSSRGATERKRTRRG